MDAGFVTAAATFGVGSALALGTTAGPALRVYVRWLRLRLPFVRSASWWVDRAGRTARPARHRARGLARAAVRRRVRRVVLAVAVFVDELTAPARMVVAA